MSKILVTGANGQLGSEIQTLATNYPQYDFTFADRNTLDLSNFCKLEDYFDDKTFDVIINCAAYTSVDKAENESDLANTINHRAVSLLAKIAKKENISLIHISTDYVFNGKNHRPYIESDASDPLNVYGKSKRDGENAILDICPKNTIIFRSAWFFSTYGNNFVKTMLRLALERENIGVIFDQIGTPTYTRDLARTILEILPKIDNKKPEIYHYSSEGAASWYDFTKAIFELSGVTCKVTPITIDQYPTPAIRPYCSLLNKAKIKNDFEITIPYWRDALKECLKELGEIK